MNRVERVTCRQLLLLAIVCAAWRPAAGLEVEAVHPHFEFALELGGDKLAEEAGGYGPVKTNAGSGFSISGGALLNLHGESFDGDLLFSAGVIDSGSGEANFSTTRMDVIYLFKSAGSPHRFGVGATFHFNPRLEIDPDPASGCVVFCFNSPFPVGTTEFDDAVGLSLRYEGNLFPNWHAGGGATIGLRYTLIDYRSEVKNVDASSLGLYLTVY